MYKQALPQAFEPSDIKIIPLDIPSNPYKRVYFLSQQYALAQSLQAFYIINLTSQSKIQININYDDLSTIKIKLNSFFIAGFYQSKQQLQIQELTIFPQNHVLRLVKVLNSVKSFQIDRNYIYVLSHQQFLLYKYQQMKVILVKIIQIQENFRKFIVRNSRVYFQGDSMVYGYDIYDGKQLFSIMLHQFPLDIREHQQYLYLILEKLVLILNAPNYSIKGQHFSERKLVKFLNESQKDNLMIIENSLNNSLHLIMYRVQVENVYHSAQSHISKITKQETILNSHRQTLATYINGNQIQIIDDEFNLIQINGDLK